jgi:hypothetical protein
MQISQIKKCKRIVAFPTNHLHKALVRLNNQSFYRASSLTNVYKESYYINFFNPLKTQLKTIKNISSLM